MSNRIVQPVGKIKLTNVAIIRYDYKGKRFEIACYKNKIINWRNGIEKDIDEVLQIPNIFLNASKGVTASHEDLMHCFGTTDTSVISKIILEKGVEQISGKEREHQLQAMNQEVSTLIAEMCYNPDTDAPFTVSMIQRAMKDAHVSLRLNQSAKKQALEIITILKKVMRIERMQMLIQFTCKKKKEGVLDAFCQEEGVRVISKDDTPISLNWKCCMDPKSYKAVDVLCQQNPSISCEILQHKYVPEEKPNDPNPPAEQVVAPDPVEPVHTTVVSKKFKCSSCEAGFDTANEHREHFRSDWHRFNLKRKNKGLPVISENEFNSLDETDRELFLKQDSVAT